MVVKVNLVGSQGSGSRLAQVARARADPGAEFAAGKNLNWEKHGEIEARLRAYVCVCVFAEWRLSSSANGTHFVTRDESRSCIEFFAAPRIILLWKRKSFYRY